MIYSDHTDWQDLFYIKLTEAEKSELDLWFQGGDLQDLMALSFEIKTAFYQQSFFEIKTVLFLSTPCILHPPHSSNCGISYHGVLMAQQFSCMILMRNHVTVSSAL